MPATDHAHTLLRIQQLIDEMAAAGGDSEPFADQLRQRGLPHISFSQVKSIEFCEAEYTWKYILYRQPHPMPAYFAKGKLLHQAIAASYAALAGQPAQDPASLIAGATLEEQHRRHLNNALATHRQNLWQGMRVLAIEHPFVFSLAGDLPPVVGVIDLVLQDEDGLILVDHKTGRAFAEQDELQLAIYRHYASQAWQQPRVRFFYDHYRWVENLKTIRKPALYRQEVALPPAGLASTLDRLPQAAQRIEALKQRAANPGFAPRREGQCFMCAYRSLCYGG